MRILLTYARQDNIPILSGPVIGIAEQIVILHSGNAHVELLNPVVTQCLDLIFVPNEPSVLVPHVGFPA